MKSSSVLTRFRQQKSSGLLSRAVGDKAYKDIQNPDKTRPAYGTGEQRDNRSPSPPPPEEDIEGIESRVKPGQNTPDSISGFAKDLKHATEGLAESVEQSVKAIGNKFVDYGAAAKRAVGLESDRKALSQDEVHTGGSGAMEYPPSGTKSGWSSAPPGRETAESKYNDISKMEKPHYPEGERSVNDLFPDMAEAAHLQNVAGSESPTSSETQQPSSGKEGQKGVKDGNNNNSELNQNLHNKGP